MQHNNEHFYKTSAPLLFFIAVVTFLWSNGFDLRFFNLSDRFQALNLFGIFLILFVTIPSMLFVKLGWYTSNYYFRGIILIFAAALFPTFVNLVIVNGLSPIEVLRSGLNYCGLFIFFLLISFRTDSAFVSKLNTFIVAMATANVFIVIILSVSPALRDVLMIKTSERFEKERICIGGGLGQMVMYSFFYVFILAINYGRQIKEKFFYILICCFYIWYFFAIEMTRRTILVLPFVVGCYIFFYLKGKQKVFVLLFSLIFFALLLIGAQSTVLFNSFNASLSSLYEEVQSGKGTVAIREDGIEYYFNLFQESGYLGIGMGSNRLPTNAPYLLGLEEYQYNPNDHGIFSMIYRYGLPGIIITGIILFYVFRDLRIIRKHGSPKHRAMATAFQLYFIFSLLALLDMFWKPSFSFSSGLIFFMIWRMRADITFSRSSTGTEQNTSRYAVTENEVVPK